MRTNQKYEFVEGDEKIVAPGIVVRRIRATVAIAASLCRPAVAPGELGGYIQTVNNLNAQVSGDAWVYDNAQVYGNARVYDNAQVYGDAWVYGNAQVYGNARVYGNAWVYTHARVYGDGLIFWASKVGSENGTLTVYNATGNTLEVTRGCFRGTVEQFLAASDKKHDHRIREEYRLLLQVAVSRIETARAQYPQPVEP